MVAASDGATHAWVLTRVALVGASPAEPGAGAGAGRVAPALPPGRLAERGLSAAAGKAQNPLTGERIPRAEEAMIPSSIEAHLRRNHLGFEHHVHATAMSAQALAAREHVSGHRVAKPVVVRMAGGLALAVVAASDRLNLAALEEATGHSAELVGEKEFAPCFEPCERGAEPPLAIFGLPIFMDAKLERERTLLMPAGTHEDAVVLDTQRWMVCEKAQPVSNLGMAW